MKRILRKILILALALSLLMNGCGRKQKESTEATEAAKTHKLENCAIEHEPEFGGVYIRCTIDTFNALGFAYGDSVKVAFSNGYELEDLPYYNGYYVAAGSPLLVAYPGYAYIKAAVNYGDDLWVTAGLKESDTATVTLWENGKYADIQEDRDISYTDIREDYPSDAAFANFRNIRVGRLKPNTLYRSASPLR